MNIFIFIIYLQGRGIGFVMLSGKKIKTFDIQDNFSQISEKKMISDICAKKDFYGGGILKKIYTPMFVIKTKIWRLNLINLNFQEKNIIWNCRILRFNGTINVILNDSPFTEWNDQFTVGPLKAF